MPFHTAVLVFVSREKGAKNLQRGLHPQSYNYYNYYDMWLSCVCLVDQYCCQRTLISEGLLCVLTFLWLVELP